MTGEMRTSGLKNPYTDDAEPDEPITETAPEEPGTETEPKEPEAELFCVEMPDEDAAEFLAKRIRERSNKLPRWERLSTLEAVEETLEELGALECYMAQYKLLLLRVQSVLKEQEASKPPAASPEDVSGAGCGCTCGGGNV